MGTEMEKRVLNVVRHTRAQTLREVVEEVAERLHIGKHEAAKYIHDLWKREELEIEDPNPPKTFPRYVFPFMAHGSGQY